MLSDSDGSSTSDNHEYTLDDYYKLVKPLWSHKNVKFNPKINHHKAFRTLVDFSLTRTMLMSDSQKRSIGLGDLSAIKIKNIDSIVVQINDNSSDIRSSIANIIHTNKEGSKGTSPRSSVIQTTQYRSCLRSKYIEFCPHTAISTYLFSRFHIPDHNGLIEFLLEDTLSADTISMAKLLKGSHKGAPMSSSHQIKTRLKALEIAGFNHEETNLRKLLLAHTFELPNELSAKSIDDLPFHAMVQLAGFEDVSDYSILRNSINPPQALLSKIFPFIDTPLGGNVKKQSHKVMIWLMTR